MTTRRRDLHRPPEHRNRDLLTALAPALAAATLATACGGGADLTDSVSPTLTEPSATTEVAAPDTTRARPRVRDGDRLDLDALVGEMTAETTGDQEWIEVFAPLRVKSWIASRYPGEHDMEEIYSRRLAAEVAVPNQDYLLEQGLYIDQPVPHLVSVVMTGQVGEAIELEVVLDSENLVFRSLDDDSIAESQEGGRSRGQFVLGRDSDDQWRIESVVELQVVDPESEEPAP